MTFRWNILNCLWQNEHQHHPGDAGRPHPEGADDAQLRVHQALRRGDEGVGRQIDLNASTFILYFFTFHYSHSTMTRTYWMLGWDVKNRGFTSSQSSTARTSWNRCPWRGGSSTRWSSSIFTVVSMKTTLIRRLTVSGETSWPRLCRTLEYCRLQVNPICWSANRSERLV